MAKSCNILVATGVIALCAFAFGGCTGSSSAEVSSASSEKPPVLVSCVEQVSETAREVADRRAEEKHEADKARLEQELLERKRVEQERLEQERLEQERAAAEALERQGLAVVRGDQFSFGDYSDTLLIGDSLMQNALQTLLGTLPGVTVNADAGRTLEAGGLVFENASPDKGVLDHVRNDEGAYARYVIGTGNNDYGGMSESAAEEIVACLGPSKQIYFITEMVVGNSYGTNTTNAAIAAVAARHSNVHIIDWHGLVAGHESEYLSDGCHVRAERIPEYAALIKAGLDEAAHAMANASEASEAPAPRASEAAAPSTSSSEEPAPSANSSDNKRKDSVSSQKGT